ncbi:hypothetical protein ACTHO5_06045 [Cytobacillus praedii]|uniref:hypothetical protein n=1 Tax=Cytobacillus praedii TaxID=1742358 RepID=UPI003F81D2C0
MNTIGEKWWLIGAKDPRLQRDKWDRGDSSGAIGRGCSPHTQRFAANPEAENNHYHFILVETKA